MKYGVCICFDNIEGIKQAAEIGYDYVEFSFQAIVNADDKAFNNMKNLLSELNIKCETTNCFLPGSFNISSGNADMNEVAAFVEKGMKRGQELGLRIVVFGSGGAKQIPDGVEFGTAFKRLYEFLRDIVSPIAGKYDIQIAIEPLCKKEVNIINTVIEGAMLAVATGKDNIAVLADIYHMKEENETWQDILDVGSQLIHSHISNPGSDSNNAKRVYPTDKNEYDYKGFLDAIEKVGCKRCSVEASIAGDFYENLAKTYKLLKAIK